MSSTAIQREPYRATKLWNEVVCLFQAGMPLKKHRQMLKMYHDCFTGYDAVEWLHQLLKKNQNFGPHVTRKQTFLLLNKFLKNHIIEDIQGQWGKETFTDNGQLFRFPINFDLHEQLRGPLAPVNFNINTKKSQKAVSNCKNFNKKSSLTENKIFEDKEPEVCSINSSEDIWKTTFFSCLRRVLHLQAHDVIVSNMKINIDWLKHNTVNLDKSGLVSVPVGDEMPCWVVSAMKCLSNWPDSCDSGFPNYDGFEKDVFKAIVEYFESLPEPLLTFLLCDTFVAIMTRCDMLDRMCSGARHSVAIEKDPSEKTNSESDRIHKQLLQAQMRYENLASRRQRSSKKINKKLFSYQDAHRSRYTSPGRNGARSSLKSLRRMNYGQSLGNLTEENDHFVEIKCGDIFDVNHTSAVSGNVGSLPDLFMDQEESGDTRCFSTAKNFKSECNLLLPHPSLLEPNRRQALVDHNDDDDDDDMCSSVEDLLLNMSASTGMEGDTEASKGNQIERRGGSIANPTYRVHLKPCDSSRKRGTSSSYKNRMNMLDGFTCNRLRNNPPQSTSGTIESQSQAVVEWEPSAPFHVYHKINNSGAPSSVPVDNYVTLPWQLERKRSNGSGAFSIRSGTPRGSLYEREVARSKSDIIMRREVPPPGTEQTYDLQGVELKQQHLPPKHTDVTSSSRLQKTSPTPFKRLSRSHSNLTYLKLPEKNLLSNNFLNNPPSRYRSMNVLNYPARESEVAQSPLSAALEQARINFKSMVLTKFEAIHTKEAFQLCLLLLPPANRRHLHLLLRLMSKMVENPHLNSLHDHLPIRSLLIERFTDSIIRKSVDADCISRSQSEKVVGFLLDHAPTVMRIHEDFNEEVKIKMKNLASGLNMKKENVEAEVTKQTLRKQFTFCKQVSRDEYESHNGNRLDQALTDLLRAIVADRTISHREKKKKLKQFQKTHPRIYAAEFPLGNPLANEKKPRLNGAMKRLRNLRI